MQVEHYREAVGPADRYDLIGGQQFVVLYNFGLREHHRLCDVGCGSLRGGRLFIPYLAIGNYYGIEPQARLVSEGLTYELGREILEVKQPHFEYRDDFLLSIFDEKFDFVLAQSIVSHTSQAQIARLFAQVQATLERNGKFVFTYFKSNHDYQGSVWTRMPSAFYTEKLVRRSLQMAGLTYEVLPYQHPSKQTWVLSRKV